MSPLRSAHLTCPEPTSIAQDPITEQFVTMAACGAAVEVTSTYMVRSTAGSLPSLVIRCKCGHRFNGPIDNLWSPDQLRAAARESLDESGLAQRGELLALLTKINDVDGSDAELLRVEYDALLERFGRYNDEIFSLDMWDALLHYLAAHPVAGPVAG